MSNYREEIEARYSKSIFDLTENERDEIQFLLIQYLLYV